MKINIVRQRGVAGQGKFLARKRFLCRRKKKNIFYVTFFDAFFTVSRCFVIIYAEREISIKL